MNNTKHAVAITLFASTKNGAVHYTKASVKKLLILLAKYHDKQIQRRWLFIALPTWKEGDISGGRRDITGSQTALSCKYRV